ncbi:hypothetical protein L6J37_19745 [Photobacterium sp. WH77]|uniref:hypothetical protein n=1 Tax=unclassified Photobacterium TaxID=2628852 RepID=UPI001EDA3FA8|nr:MULTISPECIES: hypothetical protein [unclassified Photobacterium]MCG2839071.1 hypothetical protein [Photobacterium sp. WH77]MCG2846688.1 hypothetical protein [Photobacterium sp. WH80]
MKLVIMSALFANLSVGMQVNEDEYSFQFHCDDIHESGEVYSYGPDDESDDDGYGGVVDLFITGDNLTIKHNGDIVAEKRLSSPDVKVNRYDEFSVYLDEGNYYSFMLKEISVVHYIISTGEKREENYLECKNFLTRVKQAELADHIRSFKK